MHGETKRRAIMIMLLGAALVHPIDAQQAGEQVLRGSEGLSCLYMVIL